MNETFGFEKALVLLKKGKKVRCRRWAESAECLQKVEGFLMRVRPTHTEHYAPNQFDLFRDDWEEIPETFGFVEAMERLLKGKKVRRLIWDVDAYWGLGGGACIPYAFPCTIPAPLRLENLKAADWIEVSP